MTAFFIGDVALDEYYTASRWPGRADKGMVNELPAEIGGSIANAAVVFAALGGEVEFVSLLNNSALSQRLVTDLGEHGVATTHMLHDAAIAESRNLIFLIDGEHVVLTVDMGAQPMWLRQETMTALRQPGYLYTTLYRVRRLHAQTSQGTLRQAELLADLRCHGRRLVFDLDVGGCTSEDMAFLTGAAVVIFNQVGFRASFGHDDINRIGDWIRDNGIGLVIRTMAADGCQAFDGNRLMTTPGHKVEVVDVTGAGDTFGGALTWCLSHGLDIEAALAFAVAAASRSVTIHGPRGGKAPADEVAAWLRQRQTASAS